MKTKKPINMDTVVLGQIYRVPRSEFWGIVSDLNVSMILIGDYHIVDEGLANVFINNPDIGRVVSFRFDTKIDRVLTVIGVSIGKLFKLADPQYHMIDYYRLKSILVTPNSD